jgi:putative ABC transport system permease protein
MSSLWLDLRYALRMMAKTPGLTAVLVITLALGIGASTTIFSIVNSVVLRPLPYERPDELVRLYTQLTRQDESGRYGVSTLEFRDLVTDCRACSQIAGWTAGSALLSTGERAVRVRATFATHQLLPLLAVRPVLGRWFDESEDRPGDPQVVVIGHDVWQRVFGGDPGIIGKQVRLDAVPVTVIGVMPRGFHFPEREEIWVPATLDLAQRGNETSFLLSVIARLAPGASLATLRDQIAVTARSWTEIVNAIIARSGFPPGTLEIHAVELQADLVGSLATTLWLLQGAVLFVLLIAIVNIANLLLARSESRTREVAVRHALGASRRRLVRQFVTESLLIGLCGGALGVLVAVWALDGVLALIPREAPRVDEIALDTRAVWFPVLASIAAALVFGLAPILHARRTDLHGALKDGSSRMTGSRARLRARRALVIGEIALAVVLVIGCTVMVRSFLRLQQVELGFAPDRLLSFGIELPAKSYPAMEADAFWHRLSDRLRALPGVRGAGLVAGRPPARPSSRNAITFPGRTPGATDEPDWLTDHMQWADSDALAVLGARVVRGRGFTASDGPGAPAVAMVNASFAHRFFRGRDPIGQEVQLLSRNQPRFTVIGVVADLKTGGLDQPAGAELILPLWQHTSVWSRPYPMSQLFAVMRTAGDPADLIPAVQRAVAELDPDLPLFDVQTMDAVVWEAVARPRFLMFLLISFAGIALVLAAVGIYGVMAHTVAQRTHEIGVRIALGAQPAQVRAMVLRQAAALVGTGLAIGLVAAVALAQVLGASLRGLLYGESLVQPMLFAAVALAVIATALIATWIPARRATRVEPTVALRSE